MRISMNLSHTTGLVLPKARSDAVVLWLTLIGTYRLHMIEGDC